GSHNLTVLDVSQTAIDVTKERLGSAAAQIHWLVGDILESSLPPNSYDLWHDRAVFHFLTDPKQRAAYVRQVVHAVKPGGYVIVATFGPDGPTRCSGLDVVRYGPEALHDEFGPRFRLLRHETEIHHTPTGALQQFTYCYCRTSDAAPPSG